MTSLTWQQTSSRLSQFLALTKPRVVSLIVFCAVIGMFLAVPFGVAFSFVYRFKVPNLCNPARDLGRAYEDVEFASADGTLLRDRSVLLEHNVPEAAPWWAQF